MKWMLVVFCLLPLAAQAAEVSPALVRACQGDARRLCNHAIRAHDIPAVRVCMIASAERISRRCTVAWQASRGG